MLTTLQRAEGLDQAAQLTIRTLRRINVRSRPQFGQMLRWITHRELGWTDAIDLAAAAEVDDCVIESALAGTCPSLKVRLRIREAAITILQVKVREDLSE